MNLDEQIKCAARELALRRRVYPKWVTAGKMPEAKAAFETEAMEAILETLKQVQSGLLLLRADIDKALEA